MDSSFRNLLITHIEKYQSQRADEEDGGDLVSKPVVSYGTAGFRGQANKIEHLFFNLGLVSALKCLQSMANIGIMVTASHNPIQDNGIKLISSNGQMLETEWEKIVEKFCNTHNTVELLEQIDNIIDKYSINVTERIQAKVIIGMDTRPSSEALANLVKQALDAWSSLISYTDLGLLTTPALHFIVAEFNKVDNHNLEISPKAYYDQLSGGLQAIFGNDRFNCLPSQLIVDCANGVGSETLRCLSKQLPIKLINTGDGTLNKLCGADYVKTQKLRPIGADEVDKRYASLDGDADRVIYFYLEKNSDQDMKLNLLDGDKILALFAFYLKDELKNSELDQDLSLGVVQTPYANGSSTDYLRRELNLRVDFADTGVKNLHKQAMEYDLGVYFEANGHGTIWVSDKARNLVENSDNSKYLNFKRLFTIINNYTGDAISDILVVETILRHYGWDAKQWNQLYEDKPNSLTKVEIPDKNLLKTSNFGQTCTQPETLQAAIDEIVSQYGLGARSFVRPSGTENVVRVYAEASTQELSDKLAFDIGNKVKEILG